MSPLDHVGIQRKPMESIAGFEEDEDLSLDINDAELQQLRAYAFKDWLIGALPQELKEYVCFVDYTVFQDSKLNFPHFYLVSPRTETRDYYQECVEELIGRTGDQQDCFSVAYHPDFVGVSNPQGSNSYWIISLNEDSKSFIPTDPPIDATTWTPTFYPLWRKTESKWPPTTIAELNRICGRHSLVECLEKFRKILKQRRDVICDSLGRSLNVVFCVPFLTANRSIYLLKSDPPFSEIAGAVFLGFSFKGSEQEIIYVTEFIRKLALRTYRLSAINKATTTGIQRGLTQAIESFAHQIKSVANAMNKTWLMRFDKWEQVRLDYPDQSDAIAAARVLPVPQLFQSIRDTLVLWSQTRRLTDLYTEWPTNIRQIIDRSWSLATSAHLTLANTNRNFEEDLGELIKVWEQESFMVEVTTKELNAPVTLPVSGPKAESWICDLTRLLTAIFDNSLEHGVPNRAPELLIDWDRSKRNVTFIVSNVIERPIESSESRMRIGMRGEDVLEFLTEHLNGTLTLPKGPHIPGETYALELTVPLPTVES